MGVQAPTGFELLRDDKNVQNHWARRLIAFDIDAVIVTVVLAVIAIVVSAPFIIALSFPSTTLSAFPSCWTARRGLSRGGLIPLAVFRSLLLAAAPSARTQGKEIMGRQA